MGRIAETGGTGSPIHQSAAVMNPLQLSFLNLRSPYAVWNDEQGLHFKTDSDIVYMVEFCRYDIMAEIPAYWFNLYNLSQKNSPNDPKLQQTIVCIVEEFFRTNPDILLYMCDTADNQQAVRARLFFRWFKSYAQHQQYIIRTAMVLDEGIPNYIALIIPKTHSQLVSILQYFDREINLFKENKPQ